MARIRTCNSNRSPQSGQNYWTVLKIEHLVMCLATMTYVYVSTKKKIFFVSLQRYEPVVGSGNLRVNSTLLAEMSAFCSQVDWEESVSASDPACSLMFVVSVPCVTSLYHINRDFSTGAVWFEELSYCSHCFHRFQSGKAGWCGNEILC